MKRASLIGGALFAATITLISVVGGATQPSTALPAPSYAQANFTVPLQRSSPDVILALSDMVDLERIIKATGPEERDRFKIHVSKPAGHGYLGLDARRQAYPASMLVTNEIIWPQPGEYP